MGGQIRLIVYIVSEFVNFALIVLTSGLSGYIIDALIYIYIRAL